MTSRVLTSRAVNLRNKQSRLWWVCAIPVGLFALVFFFKVIQASNMTPDEKAAAMERRAEAVRLQENETPESSLTGLPTKD